jgi:hypothetical protein
MTSDEQQLCDVLATVCELGSDAAIETYLNTIEVLRGSDSEDVLRCMLRCLRDTETGEVQYELVEASESFPRYVPLFVDEGLGVHDRAPNWFRLMFQSILNTPGDSDLAVALINRLNATAKERYKQMVAEIAEDTPQYAAVLERLA